MRSYCLRLVLIAAASHAFSSSSRQPLSYISLPKPRSLLIANKATISPVTEPTALSTEVEEQKVDESSTRIAAPRKRSIVQFVVPVSALYIVNFFMGLIDTISVSKFGGMLQLGALSPATASVENACYILSFLPTATLNLLAEQDSQANNRRFKDTLRLAANIAAVGGIIQGILTFCFADLLVSATGAVGALKVPAMEYAKVRALGLLPFHLTTVASAAFLATKDSATAFYLGVLQGLINLLGNSMLCPRFPEHCAAAAATATVFSQVLVCCMAWTLLARRGLMDKTSLFLGSLRRKQTREVGIRLPEKRNLEKLLPFIRFLPVTALLVARVSVYTFCSRLCCLLGPTSAAAAQIANQMFWGLTSLSAEPISASLQSYLPDKMTNDGDNTGRGRVLRSPAARKTVQRHFTVSVFWGGLVTLCGRQLLKSTGLLSWLVNGNSEVLDLLPQSQVLFTSMIAAQCLCLEGTLIVLRRISFAVASMFAASFMSVMAMLALPSRLQMAPGPNVYYGGVLIFMILRTIFNGVGVLVFTRDGEASRSNPSRIASSVESM